MAKTTASKEKKDLLIEGKIGGVEKIGAKGGVDMY